MRKQLPMSIGTFKAEVLQSLSSGLPEQPLTCSCVPPILYNGCCLHAQQNSSFTPRAIKHPTNAPATSAFQTRKSYAFGVFHTPLCGVSRVC